MDARTGGTGIVSQAGATYAVLGAISVCHCLNDLIQSLVPAIYPILKSTYALDFGQIGLITLAFQMTASLLQPLVGTYADRRPQPFSLPFGMLLTLSGLLLLSVAGSYATILIAAAMIGTGSAIFHPESSRVVRMASGERHGTGQSLFQVGGSAGSAIGPVLAAFIVVPHGQGSVAWFSIAALLAMVILVQVGRWYRERLAGRAGGQGRARASHSFSRGRIGVAMAVLVLLVFSKNFYTAAFSSYYTFYLIDRFAVPLPFAQLALFLFLGSLAVGTMAGGPFSDRFGSRVVIWFSILGALPFTLALPYMNLTWTLVLTVPIGLIVGCATPQIVVFGQELLPGRVGLVSGLLLGLSFGMGGLGAALLGELADRTSIAFVYQVCSWLPAIGLLAAFLPDTRRLRAELAVSG